MEIWLLGKKSVEKTIENIKTLLRETGELPEQYVEEIKLQLDHTSHGTRSYFWGRLAEAAPEALKFFSGQKGGLKVYVPPDLVREIKILAARKEKTVGELIRQCIIQYLKQELNDEE